MRFKAELLITFYTSPILANTPVPYGRSISILKLAFTIDSTGPTWRIAVMVKIFHRISNRNWCFRLSWGSCSRGRSPRYTIHLNHWSFYNIFNRIETTHKGISHSGIRIKAPTGILAIVTEGHIIALNFILSWRIIKQPAKVFRAKAFGCICVTRKNRFLIRS